MTRKLWLMWRVSLIYELITGIDDVQSIPVIITGIANRFFDVEKKNAIPGIDNRNSIQNTALKLWKPDRCSEKQRLMPWLIQNTQCREEEESLLRTALVDCYVSHGTRQNCGLFCSVPGDGRLTWKVFSFKLIQCLLNTQNWLTR